MRGIGDSSAGRGAGALVAIVSVVAVSAEARALELCVTCDGPAARYTCTFKDSAAQPGDARFGILCITELAKAGGHASCAVDRTVKGNCGGTIKILAAPDAATGIPTGIPTGAPTAPQLPQAGATPPLNAPATPTAPQAANPPNTQPAQQNPVAKPTVAPDKPLQEAPPRTVQEMIEKGTASAGKSLEKTGDAAAEGAKATGSVLENAGKAVGNAAKKTWTCITSLFGDC